MQTARTHKPIPTLLSHSVIPVALGTTIYVFFGSESLAVFRWLDLLGLRDSISSLRAHTFFAAPRLPEWIRYSFPDGLWVYSITAAMCVIWKDSTSVHKLPWIAIGFVAASTAELGQMVRLVPGTFDPIDLLSYSLAFILAYIFAYHAPLHRRLHN